MAVATGIRERIGIIAESTIGTTPASPNFQIIETTGFTINPTKDVIQDNRLGNRNRRCNKPGNKSVSGDLPLLLVYGAYDNLIEAAFCGTWSADTLVNGTTRRGFTIMRENPEITATPFRYYRGMEVNTMSLELTQNDNVSLTFGMVGVEAGEMQTALAGQDTTPAVTDCAFDYKHGSLTVDGVARAQATAFSIQVDNGIETSFVLFKDTTGDKPFGKFDVTGNITLQFDSAADYDAFINGDKVAIVLTLQDAATNGNEYELTIPKAMFNTGATDTGGEGEITISLDFAAEYDDTIDGTLQLVRTPAA